jgi:hypothetical protein
MPISDTTLSYREQEAFAAKIKKVVVTEGLYDVLSILVNVAIDRIFEIEDDHERLRAGALFLKEFDFLYALTKPVKKDEKGKKVGNKEQRLPSLKIVARLGKGLEYSGLVELEESEAVMLGLGDFPATYQYEAILRGVPDGVGLMLRDYPKERDRDRFVPETIGAAVFQRSDKKSLAAKKQVTELNAQLLSVTDSIAAIRDDRARNAVILEGVDALTRLVKSGFGE